MVKKKAFDVDVKSKRDFIDPSGELTIGRQCELLGLPRSTFYYEPCRVNEYDLMLMRLIDEIFMRYPFYGSRRIKVCLENIGHRVCRDTIRNLMSTIGLQTVYPKQKLSTRNPDHIIYPYLLRNVEVTRCNQVWSSDITYIPMKNGFLYLVAIIDWFSRYVISWRLSNSLEGVFCREAVEDALRMGRPEIFNVDQGCQFTCREFVEMIVGKSIRLSMDGQGRCLEALLHNSSYTHRVSI